MKREDIYHSDPGILGGTPVFTGTRVPVDSLIAHLKAGDPIEEFLTGFPSVRREQAEAFRRRPPNRYVSRASQHMRVIQCLALLLLCAHQTPAQEHPGSSIPDTLDWHRYFPLEIGNIWEYEIIDAPSFVHAEIIGDTLAQGRQYFILKETIPLWQRPPRINTFYMRYDTAGVVVQLPSIEADTLTYPRPLPFEGGVFHEYIDLRRAFGDTLYYDADIMHYFRVSGGYQQTVSIKEEQVEVAALKCFDIPPAYFSCYATDIGWLRGGSLEQAHLSYAKVMGREYGTRQYTAVEDQPGSGDAFGIEAAYPNPFTGEATVVYRLARTERVLVEVFNALGQRLRSEQLPHEVAGAQAYTLKGEGLAPGIYFVRLSLESGSESVWPVVLHE